jgi:hypothetical protein
MEVASGAGGFEASDLAEELEMSIAKSTQPQARSRSPQWAAASIRLPLANFNIQTKPEPASPSVAAPEQAAVDADVMHELNAQPDLGFPAEQDRHEPSFVEPAAPAASAEAESSPVDEPLFNLAAAARDDRAIQPDAALTQVAYPQEQRSEAGEVDDLLADILRYPMPQRGLPIASRGEQAEDRRVATALVQPAVEAPGAKVLPREEADLFAADSDDPFASHEFDFDIADIELELAELNFTPEEKAAASAASIAASVAAPVTAAAISAALSASRPAPAIPTVATAAPTAPQFSHTPRPEMTAARSALATVAPTAVPVASEGVSPDADQSLPFDPSDITDTGERVETFEGMHVPLLPQTDQEEPVAAPHDFDFDIDAEMASLFGTPANPDAQEKAAPAPALPRSQATMPAAWAKHAAEKAASAEQPAAKKDGEELDEFERALEEDFRRSVREAAGPAETATRMTLETANVVADRQRARSMRGMAAGVAAIVVFGLGVYGVREWVSHGSSLGVGSGQPRIITADNTPVKVAPEAPGGKVVPNQDKAVYDRVTGDAAPAPKQKELVSSSEQPVDVVQKTLIPENEDGDGDMQTSATPVGETEDPRLLPNQAAGGASDSAEDQKGGVPSVSPRKVRTMIVKPDGTLVARDEAAPGGDNNAKAAAPAAKPATPPAAPAAIQAASAKPQPATVAPATQATVSASDSEAPSAESTPIRVVKTSKVSEPKAAPGAAADNKAPIAAAQPAAQPAAQAPASKPAAQAPAARTASASPAARPAKPASSATAPAAAADKANAHPASTQVASAAPATQLAQPAPAASGAGGYVVQIASLPSEDEANRSKASLSAKFASVIGGHPIEVKRADIAGKGTYYRVRVVAGSKDEAANLCVRYRAAGGSCLISR